MPITSVLWLHDGLGTMKRWKDSNIKLYQKDSLDFFKYATAEINTGRHTDCKLFVSNTEIRN